MYQGNQIYTRYLVSVYRTTGPLFLVYDLTKQKPEDQCSFYMLTLYLGTNHTKPGYKWPGDLSTKFYFDI